jgi:hypothetical protein
VVVRDLADGNGAFRIDVPMVHGVSVRAMAVGTRAALATPVWD